MTIIEAKIICLLSCISDLFHFNIFFFHFYWRNLLLIEVIDLHLWAAPTSSLTTIRTYTLHIKEPSLASLVYMICICCWVKISVVYYQGCQSITPIAKQNSRNNSDYFSSWKNRGYSKNILLCIMFDR